MRRALVLLFSAAAVVVCARPTSAQTQADDPATLARIHLGALALNPRLAIRDVGVDTNIYNASGEAQKDFTGAVVPGADSWLRIGRAQLAGKTGLEWTYFHKATNQRALNLQQEGRVDLDLATLTPFATFSYIKTRQRPNQEIDERVHQKRVSRGAGVAVHAGARLTFEAGVGRDEIDFGETKFGSAFLAAQLNRRSSQGSVALRYELTPLTTFQLTTAIRHDRFDAAALRNSDSFSMIPGLQFKPSALINGSAAVGFRRFHTLDETLPDYTGLVANVDLQYVARDTTRFQVRFARDVEYSFSELQPFYVLTARSLTVTQALGYDWDVVGRLSLDGLSYRGIASAIETGRSDRVVRYGAGIGRRLGDSVRVGVDFDYAQRRSALATRTYDGTRFGGSVTYGY